MQTIMIFLVNIKASLHGGTTPWSEVGISASTHLLIVQFQGRWRAKGKILYSTFLVFFFQYQKSPQLKGELNEDISGSDPNSDLTSTGVQWWRLQWNFAHTIQLWSLLLPTLVTPESSLRHGERPWAVRCLHSILLKITPKLPTIEVPIVNLTRRWIK